MIILTQVLDHSQIAFLHLLTFLFMTRSTNFLSNYPFTFYEFHTNYLVTIQNHHILKHNFKNMLVIYFISMLVPRAKFMFYIC